MSGTGILPVQHRLEGGTIPILSFVCNSWETCANNKLGYHGAIEQEERVVRFYGRRARLLQP